MPDSESGFQAPKHIGSSARVLSPKFELSRLELPKLEPQKLEFPKLEPQKPTTILETTDPFEDTLLNHPKLLTEAWAGELLEKLLALTARQRSLMLVITDNPCPEYAADLWDFEPGGLLIHPSLNDIQRTLDLATNGARHRAPDLFQSPLIPCERTLLRFLPVGLSNKRIAKRLALSERTVRNRLVDIAEKLGLENRTQIAMYYCGQWQWLERYRDRFEAFCLQRLP
jgi:DNA-binding CsgD family transcriptional regulator